MKRFLIILLVFLLCSCKSKTNDNKSIACRLDYDDGSYTSYSVIYNNNDVYKVVETDYANATSKENADEIYDLYSEIKITFEDIEGFDVNIERIDELCLKITISTDYSIMSKDYLMSLLDFTEEEAEAKKANFTFEEYISNLKSNNYVCK